MPTILFRKPAPARSASIDVQELRAVLMRFCLKLTGSLWEAEDLAQEACVKAVDLLNGTRRHPNPEAFLLRIAKNAWVDQLRRRRLAEQHAREAAAEPDHPEEGDPLELEYAFRILRRHLSRPQLLAFLLRDVFGYTAAESAELLRTTEGAVKGALHRARTALEKIRHIHAGDEGSIREESGQKGLLDAYLAAFRAGDAERLVRLVEQDLLDPVAAAGMIVNQAALRRQRPSGIRAEASFRSAAA